MIAYAIKLYRGGYIHPGILRYLDINQRDNTLNSMAGQKVTGWPDFMLSDLQAIAEIEPELFPDQKFLDKFHTYYTPVEEMPGAHYAKLSSQLGDKKYDIFLIVPWVRHGGADKGILQYCDYYRSKNLNVLLITTYPAHSTWLDRAHEDIDILEFGLLSKHLMLADQELIAARLILQKRPSIVHVVQSELGLRVFKEFGKSFRAIGCRVVVSTFTHEYDENGLRFGYAQEFLPSLRNLLDLVISDNEKFPYEISRQFSIKASRTAFVPFSIEEPQRPSSSRSASLKRPSFLWASRLCREKRPDILLRIVQACPDYDFYVYGEPDEWARKIYNKLEKYPNVFTCGIYDNFYLIASVKNYTGFVYTSMFDGTPNVLLEAAISKLPVVAPVDVGGIAALIDETTGFPVSDHLCSEQYVEQMRKIANDQQTALQKADKLYERVLTRHSRASFVKHMDAAMSKIYAEWGEA
jgi:glycosyltransferase involved in cell wall biosynthesis